MADALNELENAAFSYKKPGAAPVQQARKKQKMESQEDTQAEIMRKVDAAEDQEAETMDVPTLKRMVLGIEKKITENMQMRMKFADKPEKFMDSEIQLYEELKRLHLLATAPELYPDFVKTKSVPSLLSLLSHENTDISTDVVDLLHELTDVELLTEAADEEDADALIDALLENNALETLVQHMGRLNENENDESTAVHNTLAVFENLMEARPAVAGIIFNKTTLLPWILKRLKVRAFDANKLYATEILAVLLQNNPENQVKFGKQDGMDILLLVISHYKRREPATQEEAELVENLFDCLCSALMQPENQLLFLKAEGIELMILTMKEKRYAHRCGLKVLDFALNRNGANCERFVDIRGFKTLFPLLGAKSKVVAFQKNKVERDASDRSDDEHVVNIVCTLFHELSGDRRKRLIGKFMEGDCEKVTRLITMRAKYSAKVDEADEQFEDEDEGEEQDEDRYLARLDAGLFTLQLLDLTLGYLITCGHSAIRHKVLEGLYYQDTTVQNVVARVREYAASMGSDTGNNVNAEVSKRKVKTLVEDLEAYAAKYLDTEKEKEEAQ